MEMNNSKLYNIIFPLWTLIFFPPYIFLVLIGNLIIDSLVIFLTTYLNRIKLSRKELKTIIIRAWAFGFGADLIGVFLLFLLSTTFKFNGYNAFESLEAAFSFIASVILAGMLIAFFNYRQCRKFMDGKIARKVGIAMGIITAPWMFFIPTHY